MKSATRSKNFTATQNACNLCAPLGAALAFKGIANTVPLLHGSQGCSTYIRRYMISHFKEPLDIACSNFAEDTAIFGGGANLKLAIDNIRHQYNPELIGVATTCLSETIGDDVPMFIRTYRENCKGESLPELVHVSTPSYQGTHMQGFHGAVRSLIAALAQKGASDNRTFVNIFPGMVSPADLRHIKEILHDFNLDAAIVPDYSDTLNGPLWTEYQRIPEGGTSVGAIKKTGGAAASIECGLLLAEEKETAGTFLEKRFGVGLHRMGLPIGIRQSDQFFDLISQISGMPLLEKYSAQRGRLLDALVDGHKLLNGVRVALFGEEDLVAGLAAFCGEVGILPILCATGGGDGKFEQVIKNVIPKHHHDKMKMLVNTDFVSMETILKDDRPDLLIGHSKGYAMSRRLGVPLIRVGFPVHDRCRR